MSVAAQVFELESIPLMTHKEQVFCTVSIVDGIRIIVIRDTIKDGCQPPGDKKLALGKAAAVELVKQLIDIVSSM
jgi:hypothetical protein